MFHPQQVKFPKTQLSKSRYIGGKNDTQTMHREVLETATEAKRPEKRKEGNEPKKGKETWALRCV
jgi:hypothetical protein